MFQLVAKGITAPLNLGPQIARTVACSLTNGIPYSLVQEAIRVGSYITSNSAFGGAVGGTAAMLSKEQFVSWPLGATVGFIVAWTQAVLTVHRLECPTST